MAGRTALGEPARRGFAAGVTAVRDKAYARLERMPFSRGIAVFGGAVVAAVVLGGMGTALGQGGGTGAPVPEAVQSTARTPDSQAGQDGARTPEPADTIPAERSVSSSTQIFRVPVGTDARPNRTHRTTPSYRSPLWRHDPDQWNRPWWHWWGHDGHDGHR